MRDTSNFGRGRLWFAGIVLLLAGVAGMLSAQDAPLRPQDIERWIASMEELQTSGVGDAPLVMLMASIYDARNFDQLAGSVVGTVPAMNQIIRRHGFADAASWGQTWVRIWAGFLYVVMSEEIPHARAELEQQRQEIASNPGLSRQQRDMMLEQLDFAERSLVVPVEAPAGDVAAVTPHRDALELLFMGLQGRGR